MSNIVTLDLDDPQLRADLEHTLYFVGTEPRYLTDKILETLEKDRT